MCGKGGSIIAVAFVLWYTILGLELRVQHQFVGWGRGFVKHIFIANPVSGKKNAVAELLPAIEQAVEDCAIEKMIVYTNAPKHATMLAKEFAETGEEMRLYAVGGDGTLNEVLTGAYAYPNAQVACIPCGSGNDFIRSFGTSADFLDIKAQIMGDAISIDLIKVDGGICAAITSTGLDAEVAYNIPKYRRVPLLGGSMAYNMSILEKLLKPLGKELEIIIDGKIINGKYLISTVCNAMDYGGGYRAAPMAKLDDGVLDVILVKKISRLNVASIIGKYKKGRHYEDGKIIEKLAKVIEYYPAKEVTITPKGTQPFILNVDGECGPAKRLYAKVMPSAAKFVLPKPLFNAYTNK